MTSIQATRTAVFLLLTLPATLTAAPGYFPTTTGHDTIIKTQSLEMRGTRTLDSDTVRQIRIIDEEKIIRTEPLQFTGKEPGKP